MSLNRFGSGWSMKLRCVALLVSAWLWLLNAPEGIAAPPQYVPGNGLVAWWPFDGDAQDASRNQLHLSLNSQTFTRDRFGRANAALRLDGSNWGHFAGGTGLVAGSWTYSYWLKPASYEGHPLFIESSYGYTDVFWGNLYVVALTTTGVHPAQASAPPLGSWVHLVVRYAQESHELSVFADGKLVATVGTSGEMSREFSEVWIGKRPNSTGYYTGSIDDVGIWNRSLSANEITALYQAADRDGDGYTKSQGDCNDLNPSIHPLAGDALGDGLDRDCDGLDCEAGWVDAQTYLALCGSQKSWAEARQVCKGAGYDDLAILNTAAKTSFASGLIGNIGNPPCAIGSLGCPWIGAQRGATGWEWVDGTPASPDWSPPEPTGDGQCVQYNRYGSGGWNDVPCDAVPGGSICQRTVLSAVTTTTMPTPACGDGVVQVGEECDDGNASPGDGCDAACAWELPAGYDWIGCPLNRHYYALTDYKSWLAVRDEVSALGPQVVFAAIDDAAKNEWVYSHFYPSPGNFWIGLTDEGQEGAWVWESGAAFTWTNWLSGEPTNGLWANASGDEDYAVWQSGGWNDAPSTASIALQGLIEFIPASSSVCGDAVVEGSEDCDDGNTVAGDGCSVTCQVESRTSTTTTTTQPTTTTTIPTPPAGNPPTARFTTSSIVGFVGLPLGFDAFYSTDPENALVGYDWDFGDGSPYGHAQAMSRMYAAPGTYGVTLTVTDAEGLSDTTGRQIQVLPADQIGLFNAYVDYSTGFDRSRGAADKLSLSARLNIGDAVLAPGDTVALEIAGQRFAAVLDQSLRATVGGVPSQKWQLGFGLRGSSFGEVNVRLKVKKADLGLGFNLLGALPGGDMAASVDVPVKLEIGSQSFLVAVPTDFRFSGAGLKGRGTGASD